MRFYQVLVANKFASREYTYASELEIGQNSLVLVEFGKSRCFGICLKECLDPAKMAEFTKLSQRTPGLSKMAEFTGLFQDDFVSENWESTKFETDGEKKLQKNSEHFQSKLEKNFQIKSILEVFPYNFSQIFVDFIIAVAEYNLANIGAILEMSFGSYLGNLSKNLPFLPYNLEKDGQLVGLDEVFEKNAKYKSIFTKVTSYSQPFKPKKFIVLTQDQAQCSQKISEAISAKKSKTIFVNGVTGSGKTIVTLEGIANVLENGREIDLNGSQGVNCDSDVQGYGNKNNPIELNKNHLKLPNSCDFSSEIIQSKVATQSMKSAGKILIITPEISLGKMWKTLIRRRFGRESYFFHYKMGENYKYNVFDWVNSEASGVLIGARSALFLPYKNLRAIIIDEEHSSSLKQDRYPYYQARDMAILRAHMEGIPCILLSATPSLETKYNVTNGKYEQVDILRTPAKGLAKFAFVQQEKAQILAPDIIKAIEAAFQARQQVLLFLNRKGYAPYCTCQNCGNLLKCLGCDLPKIFYSNNYVVCHKCGISEVLPKVCKVCGQSTIWKFYGIGVEKLKEFVESRFPGRVFKVVTSDTKEIDEYLEEIENKAIDGLIATQVLVQGHDFKNISLVVVVDADMGLNSPDFRSTERVFQLWQQIRGRSGRHECEGKFMIQGASSQNRFVELFGDENVYESLMADRKEGNWPPFTRCAFVIIKSKDNDLIKKFCSNAVFDRLKNGQEIELFGPLYIGKERFVSEWRFLIKIPKFRKLPELMSAIMADLEVIRKRMKAQNRKCDLKLEYEVDPYSFF